MENDLKDLLANDETSPADKLLLVLSYIGKPSSVAKIKETAISLGFRKAKSLNISLILSRTNGKTTRIGEGWELTGAGKTHVASLNPKHSPKNAPVTISLRKHLTKVNNSDARTFLEEAISCYEHGFNRAAVVFSWVGAVDLLYEHVVKNRLSEFNKEAASRDAKWKPAKTKDDLALMKEHDFLNVLQALSILGKNVKQELQNLCLGLRNGCGHLTRSR